MKTVEKVDVVGDGGVRVCLLDGSVVECEL